MSTHKVYALLALCVLFWSGNFVLGRYIQEDIEPLEMAFFRWLFVFIFILPILPFLDLKKLLRIVKENFLIMSVLSLSGITLYNTILYFALHTTTATNALLINSITPIIIIVYAFFILKTQLSKLQLAGVLLSTLGVIFIVLKGELSNIRQIEFSMGDIWIIVTANIWAIYSVLLRYKPKGLNLIELFVCFVILGFIFLLPLYLYQGYSIEREIAILQNNWYFFVYVSLCASILSYYFWNTGIETIGAHQTGQFTHLMPIFGSILAYIFLGETLNYYHLLGGLLIALGIYMSLFLKGKNYE